MMEPISALAMIQLLIKYGPEVYLAARKLLAKKEPTEDDFAILDAILEKKGSSYFPPKVGA